ncbi:pdz/dhr/glgf [Moelleriella libera RCEF 2490]|uniref:Probable 26S proteasome regulatory subunit p27 n=1 Tax=Moelleriella libera RCEF 2490 TaxID=1081109 RepID=A0A166P6J6_9HYPO|nr:pdz/dhr/glgf [Moelleriella libera RCEF 2490]
MDTIHAPTVPSGPTSNGITNGDASHLSFQELQRKKLSVEEELKTLGRLLENQGANMNTGLLTRDGFPRSDLDVASIRTLRARIICLRNDYKGLMEQIEKRLHEHFASLDQVEETQVSASSVGPPVLADSRAAQSDEAFARVISVDPNSPADRAGLMAGDRIRTFGWINNTNHDNLRKVAECVQGNEGNSLLVTVSRAAGAAQPRELGLHLTPTRDWGGRGMLGCHIVPL